MRRILSVLVLTVAVTLAASEADAKDHKKKGATPAEPATPAQPAEPASKADALPTPAIVAYRHGVMEAVGGHMGAIKQILKGEVDRAGDLAYHAAALHGSANDLAGLFPADTGPDVASTRALPAIWEQGEDFAAAITAYEEATANLVTVVAGGDMAASMEAFGKVGQSCGGCHKPFRAEAR